MIEVAASSLVYDRSRKASAYARTGIPKYWIVTLENDSVETFAEPIQGSYSLRETYLRTSEIPLPLAGNGSISIREILPS